MGKRGPAKKPTPLAILHGDPPGTINHNAPVPMDGDPEPPYPLAPAVQEVWDKTVVQLRAMRTLSAADADTLAAYCEAVIQLARCSSVLNDPENDMHFLLLPGAKTGAVVRNPIVSMQRDAATLVRILAREFGLTPSARSDINAAPTKGTQASGPERLLS